MRYVVSFVLLILVAQTGVKAATCNPEFRPLLFIHGFLGSGDTFGNQALRFKADGYCTDRIWVFDWNSINRSSTALDSLDRYVDYIRQVTGFSQIDLAGHSAGGGIGYSYLSVADRASKIANYIHVGSGKQSAPAGPGGSVRTLNVWSPDDKVVPGGDIAGAENAVQPGTDHYEVLTSLGSYEAMFKFLTGKDSPGGAVDFEPRVKISGRVLSLGENIPAAGAKVIAFALSENGKVDLNIDPVEFMVDENGNYAGIELLKKDYLFQIEPQQGRKIFYYRPAFNHSDDLVYFRTLPGPESMASLLFAGLPREDGKSAMILFGALRAFTFGRDELELEGSILTTEALTAPSKTTIAMVLYDDGDGKSSLGPVGAFANFPFLEGVDKMLSPEQGVYTLRLNGQEYLIPAIPSSEGPLVIVLDF